jgi:hypothetical protein
MGAKPKPTTVKAFRLKVAFPKLALPAGTKVFEHPKAVCGEGRMPAALEPRPDACWFPVLKTDVEPVGA